MLFIDKLKKETYNKNSNFNNYNQSQSKKFHLKLVDKHKKKIYFNELYPNYTEMIADIIIYVILVCNILTILFFTLVKDVEGEIVKQQINNILSDIIPKIKINKDINFIKNNINKLDEFIKNLEVKLISNFDKLGINEEIENKIKKNNEEIFKKSMVSLLILNVLCFIILILLWKFNKFDFVYYLKKSLILGIFVIFTELVFLYIISKKYIYIDKKYVILETLKKIKN